MIANYFIFPSCNIVMLLCSMELIYLERDNCWEIYSLYSQILVLVKKFIKSKGFIPHLKILFYHLPPVIGRFLV